MGAIFQGEERFSEGLAHHVKKAPEDSCQEESAEPLCEVSSDTDVHAELFQTENETADRRVSVLLETNRD